MIKLIKKDIQVYLKTMLNIKTIGIYTLIILVSLFIMNYKSTLPNTAIGIVIIFISYIIGSGIIQGDMERSLYLFKSLPTTKLEIVLSKYLVLIPVYVFAFVYGIIIFYLARGLGIIYGNLPDVMDFMIILALVMFYMATYNILAFLFDNKVVVMGATGMLGAIIPMYSSLQPWTRENVYLIIITSFIYYILAFVISYRVFGNK